MQAYATPEMGPSPQLRLVNSSSRSAAESAVAPSRDVLNRLLEHLVELVADRVASQLAPPASDRDDEWFDSNGAAEYLGISHGSVRRLAAEGSIPTEQAGVGCKLYFKRSALDEWRRTCHRPIEASRSRRHG
jgi:excisionase family DNA binding protein